MSCHKCPVSRVRGHFTFPQEDWHQAHSGDCDATVSCELEVDEMVVSDGVRHFTFQVFSQVFFPHRAAKHRQTQAEDVTFPGVG